MPLARLGSLDAGRELKESQGSTRRCQLGGTGPALVCNTGLGSRSFNANRVKGKKDALAPSLEGGLEPCGQFAGRE